MRYRYLPHTADVRFEAYGSTIEKCFANAVLAMFNIMTETDRIEKKTVKKVKVSSESYESLLYDFLEEFLVLFDSEGFVPNSITINRIEKHDGIYRLEAEASGDTDMEKYEIKPDVKAVTYSEMNIGKHDDEWVAKVVCDV